MCDGGTILVTGAGGFIGGWLVETLHLNGSDRVRAGIRSWSSAMRLGRFPVEFVFCDVMDPAQVKEAMDGVTCVIHCVVGPREVVVRGTENVLDAALRLGVERFVHVSTAEVYGDASGKVTELSPLQYTGGSYGDSKIDAEKLCWAYYDKGLPLTVIRPSIVYGPFSKDWTVRLAQRLASGNWGVFKGYGEGLCNLIYVSDLVSGILLAARKEEAIGQAFNMNGPETITWNEYFQRFNAALGLPPLDAIDLGGARFRSTVMGVARSAAKFALNYAEDPLRAAAQRFRPVRKMMRRAEQSITTTPQPAELSLYSRKAVYVTDKAHDVLGYKPKMEINAGLEMSAGWLEHLGLITP